MNRVLIFCYIIGFGGFLFGFDTAVISGTLNLVKNQFQLDSLAEGKYVGFGLYGCIGGVLISGFMSDALGRKKSTIISAFLYFISAIGCTFAQNIESLFIFRLIGGIGVGITSTTVPLYISELAPAKSRGSIVSVYQLLLTAGILLAYISNTVIFDLFKTQVPESLFEKEVWRPMYLAMSIPALCYMIALFFLPESPRWLFINWNVAEAKMLSDKYNIEVSTQPIAKTPISILFKGRNKLKLLIGIAIPFLGQFSGINAVIYYGPKIMEEFGFGTDASLSMQILIGIINLITTFIAIQYVDKLGRKPLLTYGLLGIIFTLSMLAVFATSSLKIISIASILLFIGFYAFSLGPVQWVVIAELFPAQIRGRVLSICTFSLWIGATLVGQFFPWLLQNAGITITFLTFAFISALLLLIIRTILSENKGKSLEEVEKEWTTA